jgi:hypothetical protein
MGDGRWASKDDSGYLAMGDRRWEAGASTRVGAARIDSCLPGAQLHGATMLPSRHVSDSSLVGLV